MPKCVWLLAFLIALQAFLHPRPAGLTYLLISQKILQSDLLTAVPSRPKNIQEKCFQWIFPRGGTYVVRVTGMHKYVNLLVGVC